MTWDAHSFFYRDLRSETDILTKKSWETLWSYSDTSMDCSEGPFGIIWSKTAVAPMSLPHLQSRFHFFRMDAHLSRTLTKSVGPLSMPLLKSLGRMTSTSITYTKTATSLKQITRRLLLWPFPWTMSGENPLRMISHHRRTESSTQGNWSCSSWDWNTRALIKLGHPHLRPFMMAILLVSMTRMSPNGWIKSPSDKRCTFHPMLELGTCVRKRSTSFTWTSTKLSSLWFLNSWEPVVEDSSTMAMSIWHAISWVTNGS